MKEERNGSSDSDRKDQKKRASTIESGGSPSLAEHEAGVGCGEACTLGNQTARGPTVALLFTSAVTSGLFRDTL